MNKTLPENMANLLIQGFANAFKSLNLDLKNAMVTTRVYDNAKSSNIVSRGLDISVDEHDFSLAIDMPKEFYRPYKDSELDACINYNLQLLLSDPNHVFMTDEEAAIFTSDCKAVFDEAWK